MTKYQANYLKSLLVLFLVRNKFRYDEPLVWGYGEVWLKLKSLYRKCARWILGVHPNTSGEAVLVRLGWLSLDYVLALHGLKLFLRLLHGQGGSNFQACAIDRGVDPDVLGHGPFFRWAHEFLVYLNGSSDRDLFSESILKNDGPLREALFSDLNRCWQMYEGGSRTRQLHGAWKGPAIYLGMRRKIGTSYLHGACCGTGVLRAVMAESGYKGPVSCRKGCDETETLEHIIFECQHFSECRIKIKRACANLQIPFNLTNTMCHPGLHYLTEKFFIALYE